MSNATNATQTTVDTENVREFLKKLEKREKINTALGLTCMVGAVVCATVAVYKLVNLNK